MLLVGNALAQPLPLTFLDYSNYHIIYDDEMEYPCVGCCVGCPRDLAASIPTSGIGLPGRTFGSNYSATLGEWPGNPGDAYMIARQTGMARRGAIRLTANNVDSFRTPGGRLADHVSGILNSTRRFGYGIIEARIKLQEEFREYAGYNWSQSAFWTDGGEIDLIDVAGPNWLPQRVIDWQDYPAYSIRPNVTTNTSIYEGRPFRVSPNRTITDLGRDFHKYSCVWTPTEVGFYLDDVFIWSCPYTSVRTYDMAFRLQFVLFAFSAKLDTAGNVVQLGTDDGKYIEIDWIRAWEQNTDPRHLDLKPFALSSSGDSLIPAGRFKNNTVAIGAADKAMIYRANDSNATVIEAAATTITGTFVADQSATLVVPYQTHTGTTQYRTTNGFMKISAAPYTAAPCPPILGEAFVCTAEAILLEVPSLKNTGGTWSSSDPAIAAFRNRSEGSVTGLSAGTVTITFSAPGCTITKTVTVGDCE